MEDESFKSNHTLHYWHHQRLLMMRWLILSHMNGNHELWIDLHNSGIHSIVRSRTDSFNSKSLTLPRNILCGVPSATHNYPDRTNYSDGRLTGNSNWQTMSLSCGQQWCILLEMLKNILYISELFPRTPSRDYR